MVLAIKATVIVDDDLDYYRYIHNNSYFCKFYYSIIVKKKISKFGSTNYINILLCQKYLDDLNNLTFIKKTFITCIHSIISIIKCKLSRTSLTTLYH